MIGASTLLGMPVVISPDLPRYTLPAELLPGVHDMNTKGMP